VTPANTLAFIGAVTTGCWVLRPYMGMVTSNCEDNANLAINDCLIWPESIQANSIVEKRASTPVFVAIHPHLRSLFE
jgi:hypothetical protein